MLPFSLRLIVLLCAASAAAAQVQFTQRGFLETRATLYPQTAPNDSGHIVGDALLRWEPTVRLHPSLTLLGGFDARTDTHRQVERTARLDWQDRRLQRPAFSLRRLSFQWHRGPVTVEAGKQFIRWGKADILNPTDRFAPRDYLSVSDTEFLGITAARVTYESGAHTFDLVAAPRFTPSRTPLLNQRWTALPPELNGVRLDDAGTRFPGRAQFGARWNWIAPRFEMSTVFYDGYHHLPLVEGTLTSLNPLRVRFERVPPQLRLYGADAAMPLPWFTVKAEAAWFTSTTPTADEYVIWVLQAERLWGEWTFVGGYAGEAVTARRNPLAFAPDRGLARSFLGRASYTIGPRRSVAFEAAVRQSGDGSWWKAEYSHQFGTHWRATAGGALIRGSVADFLGQYRRNSHLILALRYSF